MRVGAAAVSIDPPLGLPMVGFVRQWQTASGIGLPLEATAVAFESGSTRVVIVGLDTVGIQTPEADRLRVRVSAAIDAPAAHVLLNWSHTHLAPPGGRSLIAPLAQVDDPELTQRCDAYVDAMHEKVVEVARLAVDSMEDARVVWGLGYLDEAVNRRERVPDGSGVILGWNPDGLVDTTVPVLQARRADETPICTVVGYGCHTVTTGPDVTTYSADFGGALRAEVRRVTGGECVYIQAAAGNVLPRSAFTESEEEAQRLGRALAGKRSTRCRNGAPGPTDTSAPRAVRSHRSRFTAGCRSAERNRRWRSRSDRSYFPYCHCRVRTRSRRRESALKTPRQTPSRPGAIRAFCGCSATTAAGQPRPKQASSTAVRHRRLRPHCLRSASAMV